jgi:prepilin-type N-terminal cleavage/methylation domain-containing protein
MPACPTIADLPSRPADTTTVQYFYGPAVAGPGNPAIKYWNNATSAWDATCTNDTGVEAVLLRVTVTPPKSPSYDRTLWVALRRPCRVPPPPTSVPAGRSRPELERDGDDESGFTLVELVVATSLLGILMVAFTTVIFTTAKVNGETKDRLSSTRASQFSSVYFAKDVQSAKVSGGFTATTSGTPVAAACTSPAVMTSRSLVVSYVLRSTTVNGKAAKELHRITCESTRPTVDLVVARALDPTFPKASDPSSYATATTTVSPPSYMVTLRLHGLDSSTFTLTGTRRTS